jgi:quercetin dioxygenase-like cupin family protein
MTAIVAKPQEGRVLEMMGNRLTIRVSADQTGGVCSIVDFEVAAGFVAPPVRHRHRDMDWQAVVTDGEIAMELDGVLETIPVGGVVFIPRGTAFKWWNAHKDRKARWMLTYTPGGFEQFFVDVLAAVSAFGRAPTPPEMWALVMPLWKKHGIDVVG